MGKTQIYRRLIALLLSALMVLTGVQGLAEAAEVEVNEAAPVEAQSAEIVTYDSIYSSTNPIPEIAERTRPAIVDLSAKVEKWDPATREASIEDYSGGSATYFRADEDGEGGYLLTNYHIVEDCDVFSVRWLDGTEMEAELVGYDDGTDIAVMRFEEAAPEGVEPIPMGDSDALRIGELAICIGNPGSAEGVLYCTVTAGIISGLQREDINAGNFHRAINVIQTDAAINSGNSGGALLNSRGELVGIPTLKWAVVYEGLSFCIPISAVSGYIDQLIDNGNVVRPRMGVTVMSIDGPDEAMRRFPPCGAQVVSVEKGSPAARADLKEKDIITEANGVRVNSASELVNVIDRCAAGDTVEMKVYRYNYDEDGNLTSGYQELSVSLQLEILD